MRRLAPLHQKPDHILAKKPEVVNEEEHVLRANADQRGDYRGTPNYPRYPNNPHRPDYAAEIVTHQPSLFRGGVFSSLKALKKDYGIQQRQTKL